MALRADRGAAGQLFLAFNQDSRQARCSRVLPRRCCLPLPPVRPLPLELGSSRAHPSCSLPPPAVWPLLTGAASGCGTWPATPSFWTCPWEPSGGQWDDPAATLPSPHTPVPQMTLLPQLSLAPCCSPTPQHRQDAVRHVPAGVCGRGRAAAPDAPQADAAQLALQLSHPEPVVPSIHSGGVPES